VIAATGLTLSPVLRATTVRIDCPVTPFTLALIVLGPAVNALALPVLSTEATAGADVSQSDARVTSALVPSVNTAVAVKFSDSPATRSGLGPGCTMTFATVPVMGGPIDTETVTGLGGASNVPNAGS